MKINKISMAIIAATAILAVSPAVLAQSTNPPAGGGAGAGAGGGAGGRAGGRNAMTVETIDKAVTLTEAEKPKVKTALEDYTKVAQEARQETDQTARRTKMTAATTDLDKKMKEILTPEQYTKFQAMPRPGRRGQGGGGAAGGGAGGAGGAGGGAAN